MFGIFGIASPEFLREQGKKAQEEALKTSGYERVRLLDVAMNSFSDSAWQKCLDRSSELAVEALEKNIPNVGNSIDNSLRSAANSISGEVEISVETPFFGRRTFRS